MSHVAPALLTALLALMTGCTGDALAPSEQSEKASTSNPATAVVTNGPEPAADDVRRVVELAAACLPDSASTGSVSLEGLEGKRWQVFARLGGDGEAVSVKVDPAASTCDGQAVDPAPVPALRSLEAVVSVCWEAAQASGGSGVGGAPLRRLPRVSLHEDRMVVSFPEAEATTRPTGMDLVYRQATDSCTPALMD